LAPPPAVRRIEERKQFFFEKKNQKTFATITLALPHRAHLAINVFWFFVPKKNVFLTFVNAHPNPRPKPDSTCRGHNGSSGMVMTLEIQKMLKTTFRAAALAAALAAPAAHAQSTTNASFLVVHGIPGRDVAETLDPLLPVDVQVAGKYCLASGLTFGTIAGPFDVPPGTYSVAVSLANPLAPCTNTAVISGNVTLTAGEYGAVVAALSTKGAPTAEVYPIDVSPVGAGKQRFVTAHAADAPAVVVHVVSNGTPAEKASFALNPGAENTTSVPTRSAFAVAASIGKTVIGPIKEQAGDQAVLFTVAVGSATTGSATLLSKVIPSVH
jgi:hypothetical protein